MNAFAKTASCSTSELPPRISAAASRTASVIVCSFIVLGVAILYLFNPAEFSFYPTCTLYRTTGLLCPGCGSLRALHHLLHGHIVEAVRFNVLLVMSLPCIAIYGGLLLVAYRVGPSGRLSNGSKIEQLHGLFRMRPVWLWIAFAIVLMFGIVRNFPFARSHGWVS